MQTAAQVIKNALAGMEPQTAIILGSGLGGLASEVTGGVRIPFTDLPGFERGGVSGHAGEIIAGQLSSVPVILLSGRVHYYEKGNAAAMQAPLETLKALGIERVLLTNSAGSLRQDMPPGSVMMISDHINWSGANPLIGEASDSRFVGMTNAYDRDIMAAFRRAAEAQTEFLHEGVYIWFSGPSFETPAEIRAARLFGADAVGMSTVPEVILCRFLGLTCAAFSVITNYAAGMTGDELSHDETKHMAPAGGAILAQLITGAIKEISK
jgi:purine-nucleoside phosphorylase